MENVHCRDNHPNESCTKAMKQNIIEWYELLKAKETNVLSKCVDIAEDCREGGFATHFDRETQAV